MKEKECGMTNMVIKDDKKAEIKHESSCFSGNNTLVLKSGDIPTTDLRWKIYTTPQPQELWFSFSHTQENVLKYLFKDVYLFIALPPKSKGLILQNKSPYSYQEVQSKMSFLGYWIETQT